MQKNITNILECPSCANVYEVTVYEGSETYIEKGILTCPSCYVSIPVLEGFPVFQEQMLGHPDDIQFSLEEIENRIFGSIEVYEKFLKMKEKKPVYDYYAAFRPFNESTRAIFPLMQILRQNLKAGDIILDLWCRTGWSGELLASLFPEQTIVSVWENGRDVLGYQGFRYWLGLRQRRANLNIIFHSPNDPLPFAKGAFALVHGLDTLHRYHHQPLISECLRVAKPEASIVFPHIHLTNSEPDPFFERGETQLHGTHYEKYFQRLLEHSSRKAFVLPEPVLFEVEEKYELCSDPSSHHYNACILITDQKHDKTILDREKKSYDDYQDAQVIVNPLWKITPSGKILIDRNALGKGTDYLLFRHPVYENRLQKYEGSVIGATERLIIYWASQHLSVKQIFGKLELKPEEFFPCLLSLEKKELVMVENVSLAMSRLQQYHCEQRVYPSKMTLGNLWEKTVEQFSEQEFLLSLGDESVFSYEDSAEVIQSTIAFLNQKEVKKGDRVLTVADSHPEFMFLFWACMLKGVVFVPVDRNWPLLSLKNTILEVEPKLVFTPAEEKYLPLSQENSRHIFFDCLEEESELEGQFFSEFLEEESSISLPEISSEDIAVFLYTSGTTGKAKGVQLTHGALYRTSSYVSKLYEFTDKDVLFNTGDPHTMSALRNACIVPLHTGARVIFATHEQKETPATMLQLCLEQKATVISTVPAFIHYINQYKKLRTRFGLPSLRAVLCTGTTLYQAHLTKFRENFQIPVYNYYGLTETCGACIFMNETSQEQGEIGKPYETIIGIKDAQGNWLEAGEIGELMIYNNNLMPGYWKEDSSDRFVEKWFASGDLAFWTEEDRVILKGRKTDLIIDKNGENIYPQEIESAIMEEVNVAKAAVFGIVDEHLQEKVVTTIVLKNPSSDEKELCQKIKENLRTKLATYKLPSEFIIVPELPTKVNEKVDKHQLKEMIKEMS